MVGSTASHLLQQEASGCPRSPKELRRPCHDGHDPASPCAWQGYGGRHTCVPEPSTPQPGEARHSGPVKSQRSRILNTHTTRIPQPPRPSLLANGSPEHTRREVEKAATALPSRDLDWRLLVGTQEGHIGDTDKSPFLAGPESDDWTLFRYLRGSIKVGEAHTAQVCSKADEDMPAREGSGEPGAMLLPGATPPPAVPYSQQWQKGCDKPWALETALVFKTVPLKWHGSSDL